MKASDNYVMNLHKEAFMVTVVDSFNTSTSLHRYTLQTAKSTKQCSLGTPKFSLNNPFWKKLPKNVETTHKLDFCAGKRLGFPLVLLKSFVCQQHCLNVFWELWSFAIMEERRKFSTFQREKVWGWSVYFRITNENIRYRLVQVCQMT